MATEKPTELQAFAANADLSTRQFRAVKLVTGGKIDLCGAGEGGIGILQDDPLSGVNGTVMTLGRSKAVYGGTVAAGQNLAADATGRMVVAISTDAVLGVAIEAGAVGEIHAVLLSVKSGQGNNQNMVLTIPMVLASIANGVVFGPYTPGFAGAIKKLSFGVKVAATTAAKTTAIHPAIGGVAVTGGVATLTSANMTPVGNVVDATAITAANSFAATDAITLVAAATTAFAEGEAFAMLVLG